jgi:UDP-N-acetylmuramoylalanine--D-glutamate ligase
MNHNLEKFYQTIKGKKIAVIGIGVSNTPLIEMLASHGAYVTACDKKTKAELGSTAQKLEEMGVNFSLGEGYMDALSHDMIFKTPGMRFDHPKLLEAKEKGAIITSEMEVFFSLCPAKIFAVTGSDGKTTTTTLIYHILKEAGYRCHLGGNIGKPLLPEIEDIQPSDQVIVELSSFQLHTMKKSPHIAVVTNVSPNHLDIHKSMEEYVDAKKSIFAYQTPKDRVVLNYENDITKSFADEAKGDVIFFSKKPLSKGIFIKDGAIVAALGNGEEKIVDLKDIRIPGMHNVENFMAAAAAVAGLVEWTAVEKVAKEFGGVAHRIEFVRELNGVKYYNDSIASSPSRTIAGLYSFSQKLIVIAGGYDKHIPFDGLGEELCQRAKTVVLMGMTAPKIKEAIQKAPQYLREKPQLIECTQLPEAVKAARSVARYGDVVVLSPACASFDLFKNFEDRGNQFKELVLNLD